MPVDKGNEFLTIFTKSYHTMEKVPNFDKQRYKLDALKDFLSDLTWRLEEAKERYYKIIMELQDAGLPEDITKTLKEKCYDDLSQQIDYITEEIKQEDLPYVSKVIELTRPDFF